MYYLITSSFNWADEIDFNGYNVLNEDDYNAAVDVIKKSAERHISVTAYIGTNEEEEIEASKLLSELMNATQISDEQYKVLSELGLTSMGTTLYDVALDGFYEIISKIDEKKAKKQKEKSDRESLISAFEKELEENI